MKMFCSATACETGAKSFSGSYGTLLVAGESTSEPMVARWMT